ncbi:hypothetical protein KKC13_09850 [bacterium]|nr:hypothetical protein [bacterium]MBU1956964.1 hypothetical protein [bacterium]
MAYVFVPNIDGAKRKVLKYIESDKKIELVPIELFKVISNGHKILDLL